MDDLDIDKLLTDELDGLLAAALRAGGDAIPIYEDEVAAVEKLLNENPRGLSTKLRTPPDVSKPRVSEFGRYRDAG